MSFCSIYHISWCYVIDICGIIWETEVDRAGMDLGNIIGKLRKTLYTTDAKGNRCSFNDMPTMCMHDRAIWYDNDELHRVHAPAIITNDGDVMWYYGGIRYNTVEAYCEHNGLDLEDCMVAKIEGRWDPIID